MNDNRLKQAALKALHLMDLTSLNEDDTPARIEALADAARTPLGHPAALCVYRRFIATARERLAALGLQNVRIATVTNFPHGNSDVAAAVRETREAVELGADEVDVVFPWRAFLAGDEHLGRELVAACREAVEGRALLKIIIESGELDNAQAIRRASEIAIEAGAHFIKTSTGKIKVNATLPAAKIMLEAIRDSGRPVGFKAAGGVRSAEDAAAYLALADSIMGAGWVGRETFRFGASSLLGQLLATLGQAQGQSGY